MAGTCSELSVSRSGIIHCCNNVSWFPLYSGHLPLHPPRLSISAPITTLPPFISISGTPSINVLLILTNTLPLSSAPAPFPSSYLHPPEPQFLRLSSPSPSPSHINPLLAPHPLSKSSAVLGHSQQVTTLVLMYEEELVREVDKYASGLFLFLERVNWFLFVIKGNYEFVVCSSCSLCSNDNYM